MAANGISRLEFKRQRQNAKLALAADKRAADGRRATLDITQLPTVYAEDSNNTNDVIDNPNTGGLVEGRPWTNIPPEPEPEPEPEPAVVLLLDAADYSGSGDWLDTSGNNNDASLQGTPEYSATGPTFFDLVPTEGDFFTVNDDDSLDTMTEISVEMWINIDAIGSAGPNMLFSKRSTVADGYIGFFTTTSWTFRFGTGVGTGLTYAAAPATGVWQQIVATIGTGGSKFYINGNEVSTSAYTGDSNNVSNAAALDLFEVNPRPQTGPERMDGKVGLIRIYNGVLSDTNVANNFNNSKARFGL